jgi:hypothetical protein
MTSQDPMFSAEDTLANHSASQAADSELTTNDTYGRLSKTQLASYDLATRSWKMYGVISLWEEQPSLEILPPSGMTRSGELFQRHPLEPIIDATESSSWPTPISSSGMAEDISVVRQRLRNGQPYKTRLVEAVALYPTPRAAMSQARNHTIHARSSDKPQNLENRIAQSDPSLIGGKLNPMWVEWLMGFPLGWTDLEDSETPSFLKSPNTSEGS